jgi:hypothetical protein
MLHERAGLTIHCRAERGGDAESILPAGELNRIAHDILDGEGYTAAQTSQYVERIVRLTRERLILMVPRGDGVAFEVRNLAEFFSARAHAAREDLVDRLERMTPAVHWRNTWLLSAGLVFAQRHDLRDAVVAMLDRLDESTWATMLVNPGSLVAMSALADGFATGAPKYEHQLVTSAMRLLDGPIDPDITTLAGILHSRMEESEELRKVAFMQVDRRLATARSPGAKTFLTGLAASGAGPVAATATLKLTRLAESNAMSTSATPSSPLDLAGIRDRVIADGAPEQLLADKLGHAEWLHHSLDSDGQPEWLANAREVAAEACVGRSDDVSHLARRVIRDSMQRDAVATSFMGSS